MLFHRTPQRRFGITAFGADHREYPAGRVSRQVGGWRFGQVCRLYLTQAGAIA